MLISVLIAIIVAASIIVLLIVVKPGKRGGNSGDISSRVQKKGKSAILKEAEKKLTHDPHNVLALKTVGEIHYNDKNWEKCWNVYKTLYDISAAHIEVDVAKAAGRMGIAAYNMGKIEDATNSLMISVRKNPEDFDTNLYLGKALFDKGTYDKAIYCLKKARTLNTENIEVLRLLGLSFFRCQKYRDSLPFLKRALDERPDDKETLFNMAVAMAECGMGDKALKIFMHLRPDPLFGAQSCLEAGKMHEKVKDFKSAVADYEIAMKLETVPDNILVQIRYRCGNDYIAMNDISSGLACLKKIQASTPGYKDVDQLVLRYSELNQNKNLQIYLLSGTSDFVALCRKIISTYHGDCFVKVEDVEVASECVEIICSVENPKWQAKEIFRFYRTQTIVGDMFIREFHGKVRDSKCDKGVCVTMGAFSESGHKYIEGRPIDLIEKEALQKLLKKINVLK
ncbi:MAG: tetratricopeptide repeat protein [Treponema sp.]|nr:tetratricopeptide repeat protein [Treponema sp.]